MTAAAATNSSTFPHFPKLALELRDQIWQEALPDEFGPALYFYKKGCCNFRQSSCCDVDDEYPDGILHLEWRHDLLNNAQSSIPLLSVNHEARRIALIWLREQGTRPFNPMCDALYIASSKWDDFLNESHERMEEPEHFGEEVSSHPELQHIAVSAAYFQTADFSELFEYFCRIRVLLVVVGEQPDVQCINDSKKLQQRWEFESIAGRTAWFWDPESGCFEFRRGGEYAGDYEALDKLVNEPSKNFLLIAQELGRHEFQSFEIRPVFAVRK